MDMHGHWCKPNFTLIVSIHVAEWAHAYRDSVYHAAFNTMAQKLRISSSSTASSQQRATVSAITTLLVEDYLPTAS